MEGEEEEKEEDNDDDFWSNKMTKEGTHIEKQQRTCIHMCVLPRFENSREG